MGLERALVPLGRAAHSEPTPWLISPQCPVGCPLVQVSHFRHKLALLSSELETEMGTFLG